MLMFTPIRMRAHVNYDFWIEHYNFRCLHSATENRPPASRLGLTVDNVLRNYNQGGKKLAKTG